MVDPISQPHFRFIGISVKGLDINKVMGLAIDGAILIETNIVINFSGLFLW